MARMRFIKPAFFLNDALADLKPLTRLLFVALWCLADRNGRLNDRPRAIRVQALPFDRCNVATMLQDLHDAKFIIRYEDSDTGYIQIVNFKKHQSPHIKEAEGTIPAPVLNGASPPSPIAGTGTSPIAGTGTVRAPHEDSLSFLEERWKRGKPS